MEKLTGEERSEILKQLRLFSSSKGKNYLDKVFRALLTTKARELRAHLRDCSNGVPYQAGEIDGFEEGYNVIDMVIKELEPKQTGESKPLY